MARHGAARAKQIAKRFTACFAFRKNDKSPTTEKTTGKTEGQFYEKYGRRIKLGIRPQIMIIVCFAAIFSLLVLAIPTIVYFNVQMTMIQGSVLDAVAKLKASQVEQAVSVLSNQVYFVSVRTPLSTTLDSLKSGNISVELLNSTRDALDASIAGTEYFSEVRLYDINSNLIVSSSNLALPLLPTVSDLLYPLHKNTTAPAQLFARSLGPYYTGPVSNITYQGSLNIVTQKHTEYMGMTYPIYSNVTSEYQSQFLTGFVTILVNVSSVQSAVSDNSAAFPNGEKVKYLVIRNLTVSDARFLTIFPNEPYDQVKTAKHYGWIKTVLSKDHGSIARVSGLGMPGTVAVGFAQVQNLSNLKWHLLVQQVWTDFAGPVDLLKYINTAVVIGTCVVACVISFGLAVLFIKPITKLTVATNSITRMKNAFDRDLSLVALSQYQNSEDFGSMFGRPRRADDGGPENHTGSRGVVQSGRDSSRSLVSFASGAHSSGLRLPGKIPQVSSLFKDELTELTDAFNIMTEELETQYRFLEERVRMRTRELEASKIEAESANEAKTVFIANISHELRTPLNGILGMTAIAMEEKDRSRIDESLKLIYRSGELLLHILTELLTYSKNTLNRSKLEPIDFKVPHVADQVMSVFGNLAQDQRVNLGITVKPNALQDLVLHGDCNRISQVVMNLVSNALKFTPVEGSVAINFKLLGEYDEATSREYDYSRVIVKLFAGDSAVYDGIGHSSNLDSPRTPQEKSPSKNTFLTISVLDSPQSTDDTHSVETLSSSQLARILEGGNAPPSRGTVATADQDGALKATSLVRDSTVEVEDGNSETNLSVATSRESQHPRTWVLVVEVSDTGPGIDLTLQEKIFEPFIQGDQTLSRSYGGTGLGLSICRQFATMMKGTLTLKSEMNVGSVFTFTVPLEQSRENAANTRDIMPPVNQTRDTGHNHRACILPAITFLEVEPQGLAANDHAMSADERTESATSLKQKDTDPGSSTNNHRFLVVEDNKVNQEVMRRMLKLEGWTNIVMACDGEEALVAHEESVSTQNHFDLIFMDIQMPKMDGLTATKTIRQTDKEVPIVALTAFADESNVKECLNSGMTGFLSKPLRKKDLYRMVGEICPHVLDKKDSRI